MATATDSYDRLIGLLDAGGARYRVLDHPPEGRTDLASRLRGHALEQAAKCMVVRIGLARRRQRRYLLVVVPGDRQVDMEELRVRYDGSDAALAGRDTAERLAGSACGSIVPFSFSPDLELLADPGLLRHEEIYFNAARLDRSVALSTPDYVTLAQPRLAPVAV